MKKKLFASALALCLLPLAACAGQTGSAGQTDSAAQPQSAAATQQSTVFPQQSDNTQTSLETAALPAESPAISTEQQSAQADSLISEDAAKQAAFSHAGVEEADVSWLRVSLEYDDGIRIYDVEFYVQDKEYDYNIDAANGTVVSYDYELEERHTSQKQGTASSAAGSLLSEEEAKLIALEQVSGATEEHIRRLKLDRDDGRDLYEIEIRMDRTEWEFEIDAQTGEIISMEKDD